MSEGGSERDYAVGRGKPPVHSRFKPGQSGNPRGRPKGSLNLDTLLEAALATKVTVTENGRRVKLSKSQLATIQLANKAAKGDQRALDLVFKRLDRAKALEAAETAKLPDQDDVATPEDDEHFAAIISRLKRGEPL